MQQKIQGAFRQLEPKNEQTTWNTSVIAIRSGVVIATKFGLTKAWGVDSRPEHIPPGSGAIGVPYQYRPDPNVPVADVIRTMKDFVDAGKVKYLCLSEADEQIIRRATLYIQFCAAIGILDLAGSRGIVLPTRHWLEVSEWIGAISRALTPFGSASWWAPENFEKNQKIVSRLTELASRKSISRPSFHFHGMTLD